LRKLRVKGLIEIDAIRLGGMRLNKLSAMLLGNGGIIDVKPVSFALYGGRLNGSTTLDVRDSVPVYQLYTRAENIHIGELLKDAVGQDLATVEGISALNVNIATRGDRPSLLKRQLHGEIGLNIERGKLRDKKFAEKLEKLSAWIEKRAARKPDEVVVFDHLGATLKANQGVLRNKDLRLNTLLLDFRGEGTIDLPADRVDYALYPVLSGKRKDLLLAPITIEGALNKPKYGLDLTHFAREELRRDMGRLGEGVQEQTEHLRGGFQQFTEDLNRRLHDSKNAIKNLFDPSN
jgi:AsmA protein